MGFDISLRDLGKTEKKNFKKFLTSKVCEDILKTRYTHYTDFQKRVISLAHFNSIDPFPYIKKGKESREV